MKLEKLKKVIIIKIEKTNSLWELIQCLDVCRHLALEQGDERGKRIGMFE
jgi:hypothetical protein